VIDTKKKVVGPTIINYLKKNCVFISPNRINEETNKWRES